MLEYKLVSYEYFMDRMTEHEVHLLLDNIIYSDKLEWEKTRWLMLAISQPQFKKILKPHEFFPLAFDKDDPSSGYSEIKVTDKDITELKKLFQQQNKKQNEEL